MMYEIINKFDVIGEKFRDLYYSLYADKFIIEVETILKNFYSVDIELLNRHNLIVSIKKNPSYTSICYKITGIKNDKKNPFLSIGYHNHYLPIH